MFGELKLKLGYAHSYLANFIVYAIPKKMMSSSPGFDFVLSVRASPGTDICYDFVNDHKILPMYLPIADI